MAVFARTFPIFLVCYVLILPCLVDIVYTSELDQLVHFNNQSKLILIHIPKTAGMNLYKDLNKAQLQPERGEEICALSAERSNGTHITMLRSPRAHVYSQFFECKYDRWGKIITRNTKFPRNYPDQQGFDLWLDHFLSNWTMDKGHFKCYNPYNMQTRYLTCTSPFPDAAHGYIDNSHYKSLTEYVNKATNTLQIMDFIGIVELYKESFCLLIYQLKGFLPDKCSFDFLEIQKNRNFIKQHQVPDHDVDDLSKTVIRKIDRLISADILVYKFALQLFLNRIKQLEKETGVRIMSSKVAERLKIKLNYVVRENTAVSPLQEFIDKNLVTSTERSVDF